MSSDITTNSGGRNEAVVESKPYQEIVPFYGRYSIILKNDKKCEAAAKSITISCQEIAKVAAKDPSWKCLQESLFSLQSSLLDPERTLREYHLDLLQEAILPYIRDMVSRIHFSKSRFHQLQVLLDLVSGDAEKGRGGGAFGDREPLSLHPAYTLLEADKVLRQVEEERAIWTSQLSLHLERGLRKQWYPILADNRRMLQGLGSRLVGLGLVEVVGRPVIMLYPLYFVLQEVMQVLREFEVAHKLSPKHLFQIAKIVLILSTSAQILGILTMYTGLGYTCLVLGALALVIGAVTDLNKHAAPVLAPHMAQLDVLFAQVAALEGSILRAISSSSSSMGASSSFSASPFAAFTSSSSSGSGSGSGSGIGSGIGNGSSSSSSSSSSRSAERLSVSLPSSIGGGDTEREAACVSPVASEATNLCSEDTTAYHDEHDIFEDDTHERDEYEIVGIPTGTNTPRRADAEGLRRRVSFQK